MIIYTTFYIHEYLPLTLNHCSLGGAVKSWEKDQMPINDIINSPKNVLIIQVPFQAENKSFNELIKSYSKMGKRTIPLSEIAIAILMCNTERFCNPEFKLAEEVFSTKPTRLPTQNPLAQDTQSEYFTVSCKSEDKTPVIIPDTFENQIDMTVKVENKVQKPKCSEQLAEKDSCTTREQSTKRDNNEEARGNPFKKVKLDHEKIR